MTHQAPALETMGRAGLDVHAAVAANLWPQLANETVLGRTFSRRAPTVL